MSNFLFLGILVFFIFYIFVNVIVFMFRILSSVSEATKKNSSLEEQRNRQSAETKQQNTTRNKNAYAQARKSGLPKTSDSYQAARNRIQSNKETPTARETFSAERVSQEGKRFERFDSRQGRAGKEGSQGVEGTEFHSKEFHSAKKDNLSTANSIKNTTSKQHKKHNGWLQAIVYKEILDRPRSQRSIR